MGRMNASVQRMALRFSLLPLIVVIGGLTASTAQARTWYIQADGLGDAPTIQAGINSAATGDVVLVGPGTYHEQIDFKGKNITVRGEMGAAATILDGTGLGIDGVLFQSGETRSAVLDGFTITHSKIGVTIFQSQPSILRNIVTGNGGLGLYAGILCTANGQPGPWSPLIQENAVTNNLTTGTGSGIAAFKKMTPEILDNYIAGNHAGIGDGGGIYIRTEFSGTIIRGNRIENNYAGDHGGGIYVAGLTQVGVEIAENVIWNNVADGLGTTGESGGGVWCAVTNAWIHHNTILENTGRGPNSTYGGGIGVHEPGSPVIEQNIIAFTTVGGGVFCHTSVTATIRNNLGWQNLPVEGVGLCSTWWQSDGNVIADPLFCGRESGDFSVADISPALTHPNGPLGALPTAGCSATPVAPVTWGRLKTLYR
jgi:predicted outer membrane repeat protein